MFSNRNMEEQKSSVGITCICPICLSKDRYLDFLDGELRYLTVVLGIFSEENSEQAVCWECYANIQNIKKFKSKALQAQRILQKEEPGVTWNASLSRLKKEIQTKVVSFTSKDMEEEKRKSPLPYLPSSPFQPSSPSLPSSPSQLSSPSLPPSPPLPSSPLPLSPYLLSSPSEPLSPPLPSSPSLPSSPPLPLLPSLPSCQPLPSFPYLQLSPYLPSSPPLPSPPTLPPLPPLLPLRTLSSTILKQKRKNVSKLVQISPKPLYILVVQPRSTQKILLPNNVGPKNNTNRTRLKIMTMLKKTMKYVNPKRPKKRLQIKATKLFVEDETMLNVEYSNENPKTLYQSEKVTNDNDKTKLSPAEEENPIENIDISDREMDECDDDNEIDKCDSFIQCDDSTDNDNDKIKLSPAEEENSIEIIDISDREMDECDDDNEIDKCDSFIHCDDSSDHNTPLYLSYDDTSEIESEELHYDSKHECVNDLSLKSNDELTYSFDFPATTVKTSCQDVQEVVSVNKENETINLNNDESTNKNTEYNILDNNTVLEERKENVVSDNTKKIDDIDMCTDRNITKEKNYNKITSFKVYSIAKNDPNDNFSKKKINTTTENTQKQNSDDEIAIKNLFYCTTNNVVIQNTNIETLTEMLDTTCNNMNKLDNTTDLVQEYQEQENAIQKKISAVLCGNKGIISLVQTNDITRGENNSSNVTKCDNNINNSPISNCDFKSAVPGIQIHVGNKINNKILNVLKHNENNSDSRSPQLHDNMSSDLQFHTNNDTHTEPVDRNTNIKENALKSNENVFQTPLKELQALQLIVNKITAEMPSRMHASDIKHSSPTHKSSKVTKHQPENTQPCNLRKKNQQSINLEALISSEIIARDHWYAKNSYSKWHRIRVKVSREIVGKTSRIEKKTTSPLRSLLKTTKDTEINELYANEILNEGGFEASTAQDCENEHPNANTTNDVTDETNLKPDDLPMSRVNMTTSINLGEFFPVVPVDEENMVNNNIKIEYGAEEINDVYYSPRQCKIKEEVISIKSEPIDNDDLTSTALSFYAQYYESLVLNGNSPNLIDKILEKKTDYENNSLRETHLDMEMNLLAIANNTYTNSTIESDAQVNDITSVLKNKDDSEGVMDAENNMLDGAKYSLVNLKNTEENLLEPLYFKDWVDESYNHVPKVNTKKSKNTEVEFNQIENDKRQMQACARPKFKEKGKASEQRTKSVTQSKHDSDNDYVRPGLLRKIMKRASQDMSKEIHALELMNDQQWSSHSTVESETKYIPIPKRIKINGDDSNLSLQSKVKSEAKSNLTQARMQYGLNIIKEANAQDKMNDDTFLHCVIVKSERNYHSNQANRENDNKDEMNLNELKLSDDPSLNHLNKKKLKEPTETKAEVNAKSNVLKKTLNSFLKKDGQQIRKQIPIETGEVNLSKLLLVPVVTLEKNEILDRKMETKSDRINETKKKDKKKTIDPETNEKKLTPNDFIENNKEITLEELGGEFSDDETYNSEATQIDKPSSNIEINEEKSNVKNKTKILKSLYTEEVIDSNELELLRETLKEGNFFKTALYKCYLCVQVFSGTRDLRNHKRLHKKGAGTIICGVCLCKFRNIKALELHINMRHRSCYKCRWCDRKFLFALFLRNHVEHAHPQTYMEITDRVTYGCDQCGKRFPVRSTLNKHHIKIHGTRLYAKNNTTLTVNNSPENNTCIMENNPGLAENIPGPSDDNSCLTENNTRLPENNNSCSAENNLCQTNDKVSSVENKLSSKGKIFESTENDTKEYRCFICNNQFESFELLLIHQTCRHNNGIVPISNEMDNKTDDHNLSCFLCQNRYKRFAWLISHQKTKHKEHIIENDNTTKTLPSTLKNRPRKVYKPKSYACFICSDDFPSFCTLLNHQIDYHSNGIISESNLSLTDNNLSSIGHDSALLVNNLPTTEKTPTLTENNLSTTGNNLTLTEKNLPTTGNIVTFTENNSNSELYEHSCFLCDKRYKRFDTLLLHQRDKHKDKRMTFS